MLYSSHFLHSEAYSLQLKKEKTQSSCYNNCCTGEMLKRGTCPSHLAGSCILFNGILILCRISQRHILGLQLFKLLILAFVCVAWRCKIRSDTDLTLENCINCLYIIILSLDMTTLPACSPSPMTSKQYQICNLGRTWNGSEATISRILAAVQWSDASFLHVASKSVGEIMCGKWATRWTM